MVFGYSFEYDSMFFQIIIFYFSIRNVDPIFWKTSEKLVFNIKPIKKGFRLTMEYFFMQDLFYHVLKSKIKCLFI